MYEIILPNGDHAEAPTASAALLAARTMAEDAPARNQRALNRGVIITRDGQYDGKLTMTARGAR